MTAWKRNIDEILEASRMVAASVTEGDCGCPDEAHQNVLHDIAVDLPAALAADRKEQRASALELAADEASDVVMDVITAANTRDNCYPEVESLIKEYLHEMAARARGDQS